MQELITYCSSGLPANSKKKMLWRIVKKVQVFLPDCEVLPKDVVLVDIPGFNDSNQTREELARKVRFTIKFTINYYSMEQSSPVYFQ